MSYAFNEFLPDRRWWEVYQEQFRVRDALQRIGEWAGLVNMWKTDDFNSGWVSRCPTCQSTEPYISQVYQQPAFDRCPTCLGTMYAGPHGGIKALSIRPTIWQYGEKDLQFMPRGETDIQSGQVTTTGDVRLYNRDYIIRGDGNRFGVTNVQALHLTSGFGTPSHTEAAISSSYGVSRESESSPAYLIPPSVTGWIALLSTDNQRYLPNWTAYEFNDAPGQQVGV